MKKIFTSQIVYFLAVVACVSCLLAALPGHARATLWSPSVEATIYSSTTSQLTGPVSMTHNDPIRSGAVWTDYGTNRAASSVSAYSVTATGAPYMYTTSKWTDQLTVNVPDLSYGTPLSFIFSFGLDGSLSAHEDDNTQAIAKVTFRTEHSAIDGIYGVPYFPNYIASVMPTPNSTAGGDVSAVIDEILYGNYTIHNGEPFNLIAVLDASTWFNFVGPPAYVSAESLFGNSAVWLGGSVEVNGQPASSFTITSGSGFNYGGSSTTPVPEPSTLLLLGSGLLGVAGIRKRFIPNKSRDNGRFCFFCDAKVMKRKSRLFFHLTKYYYCLLFDHCFLSLLVFKS